MDKRGYEKHTRPGPPRLASGRVSHCWAPSTTLHLHPNLAREGRRLLRVVQRKGGAPRRLEVKHVARRQRAGEESSERGVKLRLLREARRVERQYGEVTFPDVHEHHGRDWYGQGTAVGNAAVLTIMLTPQLALLRVCTRIGAVQAVRRLVCAAFSVPSKRLVRGPAAVA